MTGESEGSFDVLEWYYLLGDQPRGPLSEHDLRRMLRDSTLASDNLVWRAGFSDWAPAWRALPGLSSGGDRVYGAGGPVYFPVATSKFVVMSVATWGLYELYWFYRNWKYVRDHDGVKLSPFWRAWFAIFTFHDLISRIKRYAQSRGVLRTYSAGWLTVAYLLLLLSARVPVVGIVSVLTFWPVLPVVGVIRTLNDGEGSAVWVDRRYSGWDILGIVLGSLLWLLVIASVILPNTN